jgi:DNA (cytosine-5)-methyltransferase 1
MSKNTEATLKLISDEIEAKLGLVAGSGLRPYTKELTKLVQSELKRWKPQKRKNRRPEAPFQVIDFFSGCGGVSLGFAALANLFPAFDLVGACDINTDALETYARNFSTAGVCRDVRKLASGESSVSDFLDCLDGYSSKRQTIVIGCAPCQGFSSHRKGKWEFEDDRNSLVKSFASIAVQLNPVCIIMENVPEMLSEKYWGHFESARTILTKAGYVVHQGIYNLAAFGVPQERFRSLIIAMKRNHALPEPLYSPTDFISVRQAISHLPPVKPGLAHQSDAMHRSAGHKKSTVETIKAVPKNGGSRPLGVGPKCLDKVAGFYDVYGRLHWDKPSITITRYARNPASGRFVHPEQDRGLTAREAAILQSFPKGFEFSGSFDSIFKQIGEAVPPAFSCAIAATVLTELLSSAIAEEKTVRDFCVSSPVSNSYSSVIAGLKQWRTPVDNMV